MIHDRVREANVFQTYTSLFCITETPSFRSIFSLLIFRKVYAVNVSLRETNSPFALYVFYHVF